MGFTKSFFVSDNWHLFHQSLPKNLGPYLADKLSPYVREMVNSRSEEECFLAYNKCKDALNEGRTVKQIYVNYLESLYDSRKTYARYSVCGIKSSRGRVGSTSSESNHSSLVIHLNGERGVSKYKEKPLTLIKDALERQALHIKKWNIDLFNEDREMKTRIHTLSNGYEKELKEAATILCKKSFDRFSRNWNVAKRDFSLQGGNQVHYLHNVSCPPRLFTKDSEGVFSRCTCKGQMAYEEQCVHEIVLYGFKFKVDLFAPWHHRRTKVTSSPLPSRFREVEEERYNDTTLVETFSDDENERSLVVHEHDDDDYALTAPASPIRKRVTIHDFKKAHQEFYGFLRNCDEEHLTNLLAIQLDMNEIARYNNRFETTLLQDDSGVHSFDDLVRNYKMSFMPRNQTFLPSSRKSRVHEPTAEVQRRQPRNRLKGRRELSLTRNRVKKKSSCSFCGSYDHQLPNCPKKEKLIVESSVHVLHVQSSVTSVDETAIRSIEKNVALIHCQSLNGTIQHMDKRQSSRHIVVKAGFYNNDWLPTQTQIFDDVKTYSISNMIFGVAFIDDFGDPDEDITLVTGRALETYIRTAASNRKKTFVFDQTFKHRTTGDLKRGGRNMEISYLGNSMDVKPNIDESDDDYFDTIDEMSL